MPIYEYACPDCGHRFDALQKISDAPLQSCPKCSAGNVKKLISAPNFVLKGSGWYKDHYGLKEGGSSDSGGSGASKDSGTSKDSGAGSSAGSGNASGGSANAGAGSSGSSS